MSKESTLTNAEFTEYLKGVVISEISIESSGCRVVDRKRLSRSTKAPTAQYGYGSQLVKATARKAEVLVLHGVQVVASDSAKGDRPDSSDAIAHLTVEYRVVYETPSKMTQEIFEQFRKVTLRLHTVPFAREWIHSQSTQMGLEPVLMPLAISHPAAAKPASKGRVKQ